MNKKQIAQTVIGAIALGLIVFWLFSKGPVAGKVIGIVANALILASMVISYVAEEKRKKDTR